MAPAFQRCESHPGKLLTVHLRDVADRMARHGPLLPLAGLFHDAGKATEFFQMYLKGLPVADLRLKQHAHLGGVWLLHHLLPKVALNQLGMDQAILLYLMVICHHTGLKNAMDSLPPADDSGQERWTKQLQALDHQGAELWFTTALNEPVSKVDSKLPWTKLRRQLFRALHSVTSDLAIMSRFQHALRSFGTLIEADRDSATGYALDAFQSPARYTIGHLDQFRANGNFGVAGDPRVVSARQQLFQAAVAGANSQPGNSGYLWTLTASTGAGKTLAALGWALRRRDTRIAAGLPPCPIIYALPFTSIIDQNAAVLRRIWGDNEPDESTLGVHHHIAEPGELAQSGEQSLARTWVEGWRADIVCTTFVQVVNALFHGTVADARRFSKLAGSILILDEVQAIPSKFWPLINVALRTLSSQWNTDVLLMTATQPAIFESTEIHELCPDLSEATRSVFDRYDVHVQTKEELSLTSLAARVCAVVSEPHNPSCLVILNTIQEALDLFALVRGTLPTDTLVYHLSTNLRPKDRKRILAEIAKCAGHSHVLIATQVVEAGVDLSFDVVFRALAPLDAVVQAAGRCNRHGTGPRGRVYLVNTKDQTGHLIYGDILIAAARDALTTRAAQTGIFSEPNLRECVVEYFRLVATRTGRSTHRKVMEAIQLWEFAFLRGTGIEDQKDMDKVVQLIDERGETVSHYVEVDSSDAEIWRQFSDAISSGDPSKRRSRLRQLRPEFGQRTVNVSRRFAAHRDSLFESTGVIHVPQSVCQQFYDINTGWKRS
ncbi:MAG: CRISPR-associated helicase Cas3' [Planctomycetes bacterium]|nr:CRISPR-associated helicase Cas3' [Planctomycetota bacterium]